MEQKRIRVFLVIGSLLILFLIIFLANNKKQTDQIEECQTDSDCVPATCCHPEQCVAKEKAPNCGVLFCSQVCQGPLDCEAGSCGCINNKCGVIQN